MRDRGDGRRFGLISAGIAALVAPLALVAPGIRAAHADGAAAPEAGTAAASASAAPVSPTSQCVEGPGAPPADPTKVTRVVPGARPEPVKPEEPAIDEPAAAGAPAPVLLELGAQAGVSGRLDDGPIGVMTRRAGLVLGGSAFVWPSRVLSFGASYAHVDLSRSENEPGAAQAVRFDHDAHALFAEARVAPFRFGAAALFVSVGGGLAWQSVDLHATIPPVNGSPGASIACSAGSDPELAFRASLGVKTRLGRAGALLTDLGFVGYRLGSEVLGDCAFGAGTAQTLMLRVGFAYDLDITSIAR